jgi:pyridoxal phosphate-dependent aminotransferase EpsN
MSPSKRLAKHIHLSIPHMSGMEREHVEAAFRTNWLSTVGPNLTALEQQFEQLTGRPSVALANGTAALHLAVKLLQFKAGDEMVTSTLTFAASCNPVVYERGHPVFIDSDRQSWNMDPNLLADFLRERARKNKLPKAVTVVHLYGQSADLDPILSLCKQYDLPLIEDAAEALGTLYKGKQVGTLGDIGIFSFNGNKIITGTAGGMLVAKQKDWVDKARFWSTQARDKDPTGANNYVHSELGYNYRLSNVLAGIVLGQLKVLPKRVEQRRAIAFRYHDAFADLPGIEFMPQAPYGLHTNWLSCFLVDETKFGMSSTGLIHFLGEANVEARAVWKPMHTQPLYQGYECIGGAVAEDLNRRGICLPSSSCLTDEEQQFVIDRVREAHFQASAPC